MPHSGEGSVQASALRWILWGCLLLTGAAAIVAAFYLLIYKPRIWLRPDIEWVDVAGGEFLAGSDPALAPYARPNESPQHLVRVEAFQIGRYEITNDQYARCVQAGACGPPSDMPLHQDPGHSDHPVVNVNWQNGYDYCAWIGGRLPTEAEWEYAARGGPSTQGFLYAGSDNPDHIAWYWENSDRRTSPVGQLAPNELGLYGRSGGRQPPGGAQRFVG
jgi:formylglycine-generating enzyme required for sulfatase activity